MRCRCLRNNDGRLDGSGGGGGGDGSVIVVVGVVVVVEVKVDIVEVGIGEDFELAAHRRCDRSLSDETEQRRKYRVNVCGTLLQLLLLLLLLLLLR